ncbi:competence protein CoiA [Gracilibacillus kekensis]|uniref:competence protein CoiA n=1 Tax=Gracilibacillus kekensis TaxID=1027249 RepID=UPI00093219DB|nr:competence protein CoiA family protein [Gracilibacillus kekensis]
MLNAFNHNGEVVPIWKMNRQQIQKRRKETFYCPSCKELVIIKAGVKNTPHFAHKAKSECIHSGESSYHENGKKDLYEWLKKQGYQVDLEYFLPNINQRPDLFLQIGEKQIAIEYQCASISREEVRMRTKGYQSRGIIPIWILGANKLKRIDQHSLKIRTNEHPFFHQFHPSYPLSIFYYCSNTKRMIVYQDITFFTRTKTFGILKSFTIHSLSWQEMFHPRYHNRNTCHASWLKHKEKWRLRPVSPYQKQEIAWRQWLYIHQYHIQDLPSFVYLPISTQFRMNSSPWIWQSRIYIDILLTNDYFTLNQAIHLVQFHLHPSHHFPLVNKTKNPVHEYLLQLERIGILEVVHPNGFRQKRTTV